MNSNKEKYHKIEVGAFVELNELREIQTYNPDNWNQKGRDPTNHILGIYIDDTDKEGVGIVQINGTYTRDLTSYPSGHLVQLPIAETSSYRLSKKLKMLRDRKVGMTRFTKIAEEIEDE